MERKEGLASEQRQLEKILWSATRDIESQSKENTPARPRENKDDDDDRGEGGRRKEEEEGDGEEDTDREEIKWKGRRSERLQRIGFADIRIEPSRN